MKKTVALGISVFEEIIENDVFYVDKTHFIKHWWESKDKVTLITRPRRFGKTLTLSMVETFFSHRYENRGELFDGLEIWECEELRTLQGTIPVISLSLANVKPRNYKDMIMLMKLLLSELFHTHAYLLKSEHLSEAEKEIFYQFMDRTADENAGMQSLRFLSSCMYKHFGQNVMIFIDEYDTPMLEAFTAGFWEEAIVYVRRLFHAAFKDNPYLSRGLMTGITRITQESVFSDLNNLRAVTTTTELYEDCFGFTQEEVLAALGTYDLFDKKDQVKQWYDGFQFGKVSDIYNPWSILNFLSEKEFKPYWMNTSGNALVGKLVQKGSLRAKDEFEEMLKGGSIVTEIDEAITYAELNGDSSAIWSWFLTTGYVRIVGKRENGYEICLTNDEVRKAFYKLVKKWFDDSGDDYNGFVRMLLADNLEGMQEYMSQVTMQTFSYFDTSQHTTENRRAEQFYHGFTIGLIADLHRTHVLRSNRESGFGRYDICIEPLDKTRDGIVIEFKVFDRKREHSLEETAKRALAQIEEKNYEADLKARGIKNIRKYGFAFKGKEVLIAE